MVRQRIRFLPALAAIVPTICCVAAVAFFASSVTAQVTTEASVALASGADDTLKVMTFNIRYDNPGDGQDSWPHRRDWVAEIVAREQPDLVGFQEALRHQVDDLAKRLPNYQWHGVGRDDGKDQGEFGPVFVNKDRWQLTKKGQYWLSTQPDQPGRLDWNAACARMVTWVDVQSNLTHRVIRFCNTHWDHRSEEARQQSAQLIRRKLQDDGGHDLVLVGDFNSLPTSTAIQALVAPVLANDSQQAQPTAPLRDTYTLVDDQHRKGPDSTWNGFQRVVPGRRIDFVFVSPKWKVDQYAILDDQKEGHFPSDHLPVTSVIRLPGILP